MAGRIVGRSAVLVRGLLGGSEIARQAPVARRMWLRFSVWTPFCAVSLLVAGSARATPAAHYLLTYDAPVECPDREEVVQRLRSFAPATTFAEDGGGDSAVRLVVTSAPSLVASIEIARPGQPVTTRVVPADNCAELVEAAALVIAILIDPEAAQRASVTGAERSSPPPVRQQTVASPRPPAARSEAVADSVLVPRGSSGHSDSQRWSFGAEGFVGVTWAMAPRATLDTGIGARAESDDRGALSPWFLLSAHRAQSAEVTFVNGSASFQLVSGALRSCPLRAWVRTWAWLAPCARVELGRLEAQGNASGNSRSPSILWAAAAAFGRAELRVSAVHLAAEAGATFPFRHDTYHFDPSGTTVFTLPIAAFSAGMGAGLTFP